MLTAKELVVVILVNWKVISGSLGVGKRSRKHATKIRKSWHL